MLSQLGKRIGILEIKKSELESSQEFSAVIKQYDRDQLHIELHYIDSENIYLEKVKFKRTNISYNNILNKWNKICMSFDFLKREGQGAFNGHLSEKVSNVSAIALEDTIKNDKFIPKFMWLSVGRYYFDKNPLIGQIVNINIWNRTMDSKELIDKTQCNETYIEDGSVINRFLNWSLSGSLIKKIIVNANETECQKESNNVFFPISALSRKQAESLCRKIGEHISIAGNFENKEKFDLYYQDLFKNKKFVHFCGTPDNGRLMTWIPYKIDIEKNNFVHDRTKKTLLLNQIDKYYVPWYQGPKEDLNVDHLQGSCGAAYFGIIAKYRNLYQDNCEKNMCTTCEIPTSSLLNLKGMCEYSAFDKIYQVHYDAESQIHYIGTEKSVIKYNFKSNEWEIRNVNNDFVKATSSASFATFAIGTLMWNITNDTRCSTKDSSLLLSLSGCNEVQFSCNNGLCINIENRSVINSHVRLNQ